MGQVVAIKARSAILSAIMLLIAGAIGVSILAYRAAQVEPPDPIPPVAEVATERANAAAAALNDHLLGIGALLQSLEKRGAVRAGGGDAMEAASKAFPRVRGLEQLAAYGPDGRTRWVMRPAKLGRIVLPKEKAFVTDHLARGNQRLRLAAPFRPYAKGDWWTPITLYSPGKTTARTAVIVAFVRSDTLAPMLKEAGDVAALFTDNGVLARAEPPENAPVGASFLDAPGFRMIEAQPKGAGSYVGRPETGPASANVVGFSKLDCCGAIVTAVAPAPLPTLPDIAPTGQWFALAAAGLMILLAIGIIGRRFVQGPADPWRDFGQDRPQSVA